MIGPGDLEIPIAVFAIGSLLAIVAWLTHAAWSERLTRRRSRTRPGTLVVLARAIGGDDPSAAIGALERQPSAERIDVLVEMAYTVAGEQRRRLDELARQCGVLTLAGGWALSRRWSRRLRAARLISLFSGANEATGDLLLGDRHPEVRAQATEWAGEHPTPERLARLTEMLGDPDPRVRFFAGEALSRCGQVAASSLASFLTRAARSPDTPPSAVCGALTVARAVATPELLGPALWLQRSPSVKVRACATALAGAIGGPQAEAQLVGALADPAAEVRAAAAAALGRLGRWETAARVSWLLRDPTWRTRRAAALALTRMGPTGELLLRRPLRGEEPLAADIARHALELSPVAQPADLEPTKATA